MKRLLSLAFCLAMCSGIMAQEEVKLPQPDFNKLSMSLGETLKNRRSYREYNKEKSIDMNTLSAILWAACGISDPATGKITAPSAMNMQDIKVYVCSKKGVSIYNPKNNSLTSVTDKNILESLSSGQEFVKDAPYTLLLVSDQSNRNRKDSHFGDIDVGYVSQNIYLACTALGMRTVARAMMNQQAVREALNLAEDVIIELNHPIGY